MAYLYLVALRLEDAQTRYLTISMYIIAKFYYKSLALLSEIELFSYYSHNILLLQVQHTPSPHLLLNIHSN